MKMIWLPLTWRHHRSGREHRTGLRKTLVLHGDRNGCFVSVSSRVITKLDLKVAAKESGNKKADLIPMKELLPVTGYIRGGCSPIGMKKEFPTFIHASCLKFEYIYISAGIRGLQIRLNPKDLISYTRAALLPA